MTVTEAEVNVWFWTIEWITKTIFALLTFKLQAQRFSQLICRCDRYILYSIQERVTPGCKIKSHDRYVLDGWATSRIPHGQLCHYGGRGTYRGSVVHWSAIPRLEWGHQGTYWYILIRMNLGLNTLSKTQLRIRWPHSNPRNKNGQDTHKNSRARITVTQVWKLNKTWTNNLNSRSFRSSFDLLTPQNQ